MNKLINIAKSKKAIEQLTVFKENLYENMDIRFTNAHMRRINELIRQNLFDKNDLFINSKTLWELMQPMGNSGSHNYHELSPEDIYNALKLVGDPKHIIKAKLGRYAVIPAYISSYDAPIMVIIEIGSGLINNKNANINKIITMYPLKDVDNFLQKVSDKDILYNKK